MPALSRSSTSWKMPHILPNSGICTNIETVNNELALCGCNTAALTTISKYHDMNKCRKDLLSSVPIVPASAPAEDYH